MNRIDLPLLPRHQCALAGRTACGGASPCGPCARLMGFVRICQVTVGRAHPANRAMASRRVIRSSKAEANAGARTAGYSTVW